VLVCLTRFAGDEVLPRCVGVAFTDSVHSVSPCDPAPVGQFIREHAINWARFLPCFAALFPASLRVGFLLWWLQVTSDKPLDTPECEGEGCPCLSAGLSPHSLLFGGEWMCGDLSCPTLSAFSLGDELRLFVVVVVVAAAAAAAASRSYQARVDERMLRRVCLQGTPLKRPRHARVSGMAH